MLLFYSLTKIKPLKYNHLHPKQSNMLLFFYVFLPKFAMYFQVLNKTLAPKTQREKEMAHIYKNNKVFDPEMQHNNIY